EPELTLSLLPSAHATVFILGADTGVTRSDMEIWRDHLGSHAPTRFVVLNKIDALDDPLATAEEVRAQIASQQSETARMLDMKVERVFPLSARQALAARIARDETALRASRLPELEAALGAELLPQRRTVLEQVVVEGTQQVESHVARQLGDTRRQVAEQTLELRGLRGRNSAKVRLMLQRVDAEAGDFEQCTTLLQAMRAVHARMLKDLLVDLSADRIRAEIGEMQKAMGATLLNLGAKKAFVALCERLDGLLESALQRNAEIRDMLAGSFARLNAEFGFSLALGKAPEMNRYVQELKLIENNYVQYLGLTLAMRLSQPTFMEQFRRMLVSKLRVVFENVSSEIEMWNKSTSAQVDAQLRERRRNFKRRRDTLERVQTAGHELETRLAELEAQDERLQRTLARVHELAEDLREHALSASTASDAAGEPPAARELSRISLDLDIDLPLLQEAAPAARRALA
ncbi:MAG TPA: dynamin family protein, partial [Caldimonas sp.]|nr:dynamin family protein [Caldimonas sp.]